VDEAVYHVLLEGRRLGPYDRRTIVGMRIKKALTGEHVLVGSDGARLTVADLLMPRRDGSGTADRTGSVSVIRATYTVNVLAVDGPGMKIPRFKGEVEARVQGSVLRLAGRFRHGMGWKEGRVKIALQHVIHAQAIGSQADLWLRIAPSGRLQRIGLELFTPDAAGELVDCLPAATPLPGARGGPPARSLPPQGLWIPVLGVAVVFGVIVMVLLFRRIY
jgi:hypothetical protein